MLWFAHAKTSRSLRVAGRLADVVLTSMPGACPLEGERVHVIGQAIDTDFFFPTPVHRTGPLRLLALGRTSRLKHYDAIIEAVQLARAEGTDVTLKIVGPSVTDDERIHRGELKRKIVTLRLSNVVALAESVGRGAVPSVIAEADVLVCATESGSADKAVFEAMACGRPTLASSRAFEQLLTGTPTPLTFAPGDVRQLAQRITTLAGLREPALASLGSGMRDRVVRDHSIAHWADRVLGVANELMQDGKGRSLKERHIAAVNRSSPS
jgi:glycosyltransferase involved in cell wall biosynthesis